MAMDGQTGGGGAAGPAPGGDEAVLRFSGQCKALASDVQKILQDALTLREKIKSSCQEDAEVQEGAAQMKLLKERMTKLHEKAAELVPVEQQKEQKCPKQHNLKRYVVPQPSDDKYRPVCCDICSREQKPGSCMRGCRLCNYGVCALCEVTPITTLVPEPWRRGMSCGQFEAFFKEYCGSIRYPQDDECKAIVVPTKLAAKCFEKNQEDALNKIEREFPFLPNLYSVNEFFIKKHTKGERCTNKHQLVPFRIPDDDDSAYSCNGCSQVQPKGSMLRRCTEECGYHVCHRCRGQVESCPKQHPLEPVTGTEWDVCTLCNEASPMKGCKECRYAICGHCVHRATACDRGHVLTCHVGSCEPELAVQCSICEEANCEFGLKCPVRCEYYLCWDCEPMVRLVSYAELLNPRGKELEYFISHHWGEDFGEFVQSVIRHAAWVHKLYGRKSWRDYAYWCCAFANNQHMVSLGDEVFESPFYKALHFRGCRGTIMNLNFMATALVRIWCCFEAVVTVKVRKSLAVCTRNGPAILPDVEAHLGLEDAWVMHLTDAHFSCFDVLSTESTEAKDREKILACMETFQPDCCGGTPGIQAVNWVVRSILAGQALHSLARAGNKEGVRVALEARADPLREDGRAIPAITYALGKLQALEGAATTREASEKNEWWLHQETFALLMKAVCEDGYERCFPMELAKEVLDMWDPALETRVDAFKAYRKLKARSPEAHAVHFYRDTFELAMQRHTRTAYELAMERERLSASARPAAYRNVTPSTRYHLREVEHFIHLLQEATDYEGLVKVLTEALAMEEARTRDEICSTMCAEQTGWWEGDMLMILLTDLEPDDVMAAAQLWQLRRQELAGPPLVCFLANFADEDSGRIFPQKLLLSALTLGLPDIIILPTEPNGDESMSQLDCSQSSRSVRSLVEAYRQNIGHLCDTIVAFEGETISLKLLAPARGHLAAIVDEIKRRGCDVWDAVKKKILVTVYSGSFNVRKSTQEDFVALRELIMTSREPLTDIARYDFFGRTFSHPMTESFTTFAPKTFSAMLNKHAPLLAAVMKMFSDEVNGRLIKPHFTLFDGCWSESDVRKRLGEEAYVRWKVIEQLYVPGEYHSMFSYAKALSKDEKLMQSVAADKKKAIVAYALEGYSFPLHDQIVFLHTWLRKEEMAKMDWMLTHTMGEWEINMEKGRTEVKAQSKSGPYELRAVRPALADPFDERVLRSMQNALEEYLMRHLSTVYKS